MNHILLQIIITFSRILKVARGSTHDFRERSYSTAKCCLTFESLRDQLYPTLHDPSPIAKLRLNFNLNQNEVSLRWLYSQLIQPPTHPGKYGNNKSQVVTSTIMSIQEAEIWYGSCIQPNQVNQLTSQPLASLPEMLWLAIASYG